MLVMLMILNKENLGSKLWKLRTNVTDRSIVQLGRILPPQKTFASVTSKPERQRLPPIIIPLAPFSFIPLDDNNNTTTTTTQSAVSLHPPSPPRAPRVRSTSNPRHPQFPCRRPKRSTNSPLSEASETGPIRPTMRPLACWNDAAIGLALIIVAVKTWQIGLHGLHLCMHAVRA